MKKPNILIKARSHIVPLDHYAGEWVAFGNGQVVAHGCSPKRLMERVKSLKKDKKPSVLLVPGKRERPYV